MLAQMTIMQASEASGCSHTTICSAENGKTKPTVKTLTKLADAYKCDITDFYEADVQTIRTLATNEVVGYLNDPEANRDRKASVAAHLLTQLPDTSVDVELKPSKAEAKDRDLLDKGVEPNIGTTKWKDT